MANHASLGWALASAAVLASPAVGSMVLVEIAGSVEFNQVTGPPIGSLTPGTSVVMSFLVDSDVYLNSPTYPTRGYVIDQASFAIVGGGVSIGLQSPFPAGEVPYFVLRNNDPAVDGFFISRNVDWPIGVPLPQNGPFGAFVQDFSVGYEGTVLDSLDILDAVGTYGYGGLTNFNWTFNNGPYNPVGLIFESMTITAVPAPAAMLVFIAGGCGRSRRRRR